MTDISFLTESVTEEERCCKEIVVIDLPECCLGTEFNLLTAAAYYEWVLDVAGASGVTVPRALALSSTPKKPHAPADPPPTDPADEPMRFESHFKSSFGNVKAFNLKKLKLSLSPSPQWPQAALRLGGDGRQVS